MSASVGRRLAHLLRHRPDVYGVSLDVNGWAGVADVARALGVGVDVVLETVRGDEKGRFALTDDRERIRATHGHSLVVAEVGRVAGPPDRLWHGTDRRFLDSILRDGLLPMGRTHVHLADTPAAALRVAGRRRRADPVLLGVDAAGLRADGSVFRRSESGVWLVEHVPAAFLTVVPPDAGD